MLFIVIPISFVLYGEEADLIFFLHFFRNDFEVILKKIDLLIPFDQPSEEGALLDIGGCHFVYDFDGKKMVSFCFNHPLLLLYHVDIIIRKGLDGRGLLVVHAAQSKLSGDCEMSQSQEYGKLVQEFQTDVVFFSFCLVELFKHNGGNLHNGAYAKFLQIFFRLWCYDLNLILLAEDDLP
jgi:hypothetical protein